MPRWRTGKKVELKTRPEILNQNKSVSRGVARNLFRKVDVPSTPHPNPRSAITRFFTTRLSRMEKHIPNPRSASHRHPTR